MQCEAETVVSWLVCLQTFSQPGRFAGLAEDHGDEDSPSDSVAASDKENATPDVTNES